MIRHASKVVPGEANDGDQNDDRDEPPAGAVSERLATSGQLNAVVGSPSGFTLTFPTAGTFSYVCLDHQDTGHVGTIQVGEATAAPSPEPGSPAPAG